MFFFGIIAFGAVVFISNQHFKDFVGSHSSLLPIVLMIIVGIMIVLIVIGCCGAAIENSCTFLMVCHQRYLILKSKFNTIRYFIDSFYDLILHFQSIIVLIIIFAFEMVIVINIMKREDILAIELRNSSLQNQKQNETIWYISMDFKKRNLLFYLRHC